MCYNHSNIQNIMAGVVNHPPASRENSVSPAGVAEHPKVELASPVHTKDRWRWPNPVTSDAHRPLARPKLSSLV